MRRSVPRNDQSGRSLPLGIGHWCLVICWSLGFGHWGFRARYTGQRVDAPVQTPPPTDAAPTARAQPSRIRRFLWPSWQQRKGMLRAEAWLLVLACYALLTFAWVWPQDWRNTSTAYVAASWVALLVRAAQFHLGLIVGLIGLIAA